MASSSSHSKPSAPDSDGFTYLSSSYDEVLEDLQSRFIVNLPPDEIASEERICFQVEQAHWYYEDFIREQNPSLPSFGLKAFTEMFIKSCSPLLDQFVRDFEGVFTRFMRYKTTVPVCGAIMLDESWEYCVLVKGWKASAGWGFPKGKINEREPKEKCAVREVLEETGYNLAGQISPENVLELIIKDQSISLFVVPGVPTDFPFQTRTRKEISKIEWFKLSDLPLWKRSSKSPPSKFYLIAPFIIPLQKFIHDRKPRNIPPRRNGKQRKPPREPNGMTSDHAQETSSQSSANGDPDTPSPHYSNPAPHVVEEEVSTPDPQLARLLIRLQESASKESRPDTVVQNGSLLDLFKHAPSSTPDTTPATPVSRPPEDKPSPAVYSSSSSASVRAPSVTSGVRAPSVLSLTSERSSGPRSPHSAVSPPNSAVSHTSSTSSLPRSSRRTSSTADISPYLTRPAEIPTSRQRMKELALLETVADESARMSAFLARQTPTPAMPPLPPQSVPPLAHYGHLPPNLPYIPNIPRGGLNPQFTEPLRPATAAYAEPYPIRPSTSQMYHRPLPLQGPASMSMSQTQLISMINASGGPPPSVPPIHGRPPLPPHLLHGSFDARLPPDPRGMYPPSSQAFLPNTNLPPFPPPPIDMPSEETSSMHQVPTPHPLPPSTPFSAPPAALAFPRSASVLPPNDLLSIFTNRAPASGPSGPSNTTPS